MKKYTPKKFGSKKCAPTMIKGPGLEAAFGHGGGAPKMNLEDVFAHGSGKGTKSAKSVKGGTTAP